MRALPVNLKLAAWAYIAVGAWLGLLAVDGEQLGLVAPFLIVLAASPIIGYGLRRVRRWAYIALIVHAPTVIAIGSISLAYVALELPIFLAMLHAALVCAFYLRADVRAPYLAREKRGFRQYRRFDTNLTTTVDSALGRRDGETYDISAGGAYIGVDTRGFEPDHRIIAEIQLRDNRRLRAPARIVSVNPEGLSTKPAGIGVQFTTLTREERETLTQFIGIARRHERHVLELRVSFTVNTLKVEARTIDLSMSGCYLVVDGSQLQPGDRLNIDVMLHDGDVLEMSAEVMWLAFQETEGKPPGAALQFLALTGADRQRLRDRLKEAGHFE